MSETKNKNKERSGAIKASAEDKNKKFRTSKTAIRTLFIVLMLLIEVAALITIIIIGNVYDVPWLNIIYFVAEILQLLLLYQLLTLVWILPIRLLG